MSFLKLLLAVALSLSIPAGIAFAQTGVDPGYGGASYSGGDHIANQRPTSMKLPNGSSISLLGLSAPATNLLVRKLNAATDVCGRLRPEYYVDCLGERIGDLADQMATKGAYSSAQKVLKDTSRKLRSLARANQDTAKPRVRVRVPGKGKQETTAPIIATKKSARKEVRKQAEAILGEAETKLLRSAANSKRRKSHYEQIAQAVGSKNKILLRSL